MRWKTFAIIAAIVAVVLWWKYAKPGTITRQLPLDDNYIKNPGNQADRGKSLADYAFIMN